MSHQVLGFAKSGYRSLDLVVGFIFLHGPVLQEQRNKAPLLRRKWSLLSTHSELWLSFNRKLQLHQPGARGLARSSKALPFYDPERSGDMMRWTAWTCCRSRAVSRRPMTARQRDSGSSPSNVPTGWLARLGIPQHFWSRFEKVLPAKNRDLRADLWTCLSRLGRVALLCFVLLFIDMYVSLAVFTLGLSSIALFVMFPKTEERLRQWVTASSWRILEGFQKAALGRWRQYRHALIEQLRKLLE
jgi:hypothetical protein